MDEPIPVEDLKKDKNYSNKEMEDAGITIDNTAIDDGVRLKRRMTLLSGVAMMFGGIVGSGIFISPTGVLYNSGSVGMSLVIWTICGFFVMMGQLCFLELALAIGKNGGTYTYIREAFGRPLAFMFVFVTTLLLRPSSTTILALTFSNYALQLAFTDGCGPPPNSIVKILAITGILVCCAINAISVKLGLRLQVVFLVCKLLAVTLVMIGGLVMLGQGRTEYLSYGFDGTTSDPGRIAQSIYSGMWAYSGWNSLNDVIEEIIDPERNMMRAVLITIPLVTIVYLLCNISYFTVLSPSDIVSSPAVASSWAQIVIPPVDWSITAFVAVSVFGSLIIFSFIYARLINRVGRDGQMLKIFGMIHVTKGTPTPGMFLLALITSLMIIPSDLGILMNFFSFLEWFWSGTVFLALLVLRYRRKDLARPFKVPLIIPIIMLAFAIFLVVTPLVTDPVIENFYALLGIVASLIFYFPFVHFGLKIPGTDSVNTFLQLLLNVAPNAKDL